ncbi:MAG: ribonuclease III [Lachnospiraceae bacterium]|nr:ribonuclease III [Ruminococcus sp.]MCM1273799.1 ribonuclease III [Lachnospiraceae bacterium]
MTFEKLTEKEAAAYSPNVLAFYGDSVYEVMVRNRIVVRHQTNAGRLHELAVERVRASYQSEAVSVIEPLLDEREADILRRGRNAGGISVPKSAKPSEYRRATALETLFGYLALCGREERAAELFEAICAALPIDCD